LEGVVWEEPKLLEDALKLQKAEETILAKLGSMKHS